MDDERVELDLQSTIELTPRQHEIIVLLGAGWAHKEIAEHLEISWQTVKNHTTPLYKRLDCLNATAAVARAIHLGLITTEEIDYRRLSRNEPDGDYFTIRES